VRVTPAILANDAESFKSLVVSAETFADYAQIDIMDGRFVPSTGITPDELRSVRTILRTEAHLMVEKPEEWLEAIGDFGSDEVIIHFEAVKEPRRILDLIRATAFRAGLAINPQTTVAEFSDLAADVDSVLFMAVNPGFYGAPFIPEVMEKVRELRGMFPTLAISVDGGMNEETTLLAKQAGADTVCVGSAIFKADDPGAAYCRLKSLLNEPGSGSTILKDCR
jgi:ribulose-phosphate 3-epimerase